MNASTQAFRLTPSCLARAGQPGVQGLGQALDKFARLAAAAGQGNRVAKLAGGEYPAFHRVAAMGDGLFEGRPVGQAAW